MASSKAAEGTDNSVYASDHSSPVLRAHSWRTVANSIPYLIPHIKPHMKTLDVGCGPGSITVDLAKLVPDGHITGVEYTSDPLEQARALASKEGVSNVDFLVGDIHQLPFESGTFDVVHAHQVLQHIADPVQGLREMRRVCKKGGLVAVRESSDFSWFPESPGLDKWLELQTQVSKSKGGNPHPGKRIHVWAKEAGFELANIERTAGAWCYSTPEERQLWGGSMMERVLGSSLADNIVNGGFATVEELREVAAAWKEWTDCEEGWFGVLHGQIICKV